MKLLTRTLLLVLALLLAYLLLWPTPIQPQAWIAAPVPAATGAYTPNPVLLEAQSFGLDAGLGPEGISLDAQGRLYVGYLDGRVVTYSPNGASYQELATIEGGHPLGVAVNPSGGLLVADAHKGLLAVSPSGELKTLVTEAGGAPVMFADDVDVSPSTGKVYFSDVSVYPYEHMMYEVLEHRGTGRLIEYDPASGQSKVLLGDLQFANGVALGPDENYVLVNETSAYRIRRYWLKGDKAGTDDIFLDNLPGLPDNLSYAGNGRFWVALYAPRDPLLDRLLAGPAWIKRLVSRLPSALLIPPPSKGWVLGVDAEGKVIANLEATGEHAYMPITSVEERGSWLYFGSLSANRLARLPLNRVFPDAPPPPPGWQDTPARPHHFVPPKLGQQPPDAEPGT